MIFGLNKNTIQYSNIGRR